MFLSANTQLITTISVRKPIVVRIPFLNPAFLFRISRVEKLNTVYNRLAGLKGKPCLRKLQCRLKKRKPAYKKTYSLRCEASGVTPSESAHPINYANGQTRGTVRTDWF